MELRSGEALAAPIPLFTPIFSPEEEIILLEEYSKFLERGKHKKNRWSEFYDTCSLKDKFKLKQISEKMRGLETKFHKQKLNSSPPHDPHRLHLFDLSKSLWGDSDPPKSKSRKRSLIITHPSNKISKIQHTDLDVIQLELYYKMLTLHLRQCRMVLQELKCKEFNPHSSSSNKKQSEEKDAPQPQFIEADKDGEQEQEQERYESEEESKLNLQIIEPPLDSGILNKEGMDIVENEALENQAADLSIACVEEKIENQQLVLPNSGVMCNDLLHSDAMDNILPLPELLCNIKVKDDGTKKTISKKKKKKKKMNEKRKKKEDRKRKKKKEEEDRKEASCQVKNHLFGLRILVMKEGDPNGKLACKRAKVKIHITGKVYDSEQLFESSIGKDPRIINLDDESMIEGLRIGIEGMRVGEKRKVIIPPSLGYGGEGCEGVVPPNSWLEYEVDLIDAAMPR